MQPVVLQRLLGHTDISTTLNTYTDAAYGSLGIFISVITSILSFLSVYMGLGILTVTVINFGKNAAAEVVYRAVDTSHGVWPPYIIM